MERELILTMKETYRCNKKMNAEIEHIKKMLPEIESFETFRQSNEVFDLSKERVIKKKWRLQEVYEKGVDRNVFLFVFNRN
jgi:ABC-type uncharacterized transport system substrate-binding protein